MPKLLIFLSFFILSGSFANSELKKIHHDLLSGLPKELQNLNSKMSEKVLRQKFKKNIYSQDKNTLYLHFFSDQNDVTIGLTDRHFSYVLIKPPKKIQDKNRHLFSKVVGQLSPEEKEKLNPLRNISHEGGSTIRVPLPEEKLTLVFANNETKELLSILYWTGEKAP